MRYHIANCRGQKSGPTPAGIVTIRDLPRMIELLGLLLATLAGALRSLDQRTPSDEPGVAPDQAGRLMRKDRLA